MVLRVVICNAWELKASSLTPPNDLGGDRPPETHHRRQLARLPFLAPDLQAMILQGCEPAHINLRPLLKAELPLAWIDHRAAFGVQAPASAEGGPTPRQKSKRVEQGSRDLKRRPGGL